MTGKACPDAPLHPHWMSKLAPAQVSFASVVLLLHVGSIAKLLGSAVTPAGIVSAKQKIHWSPLWAKAALHLLSSAAGPQVIMRQLLISASSNCTTALKTGTGHA